MNKQRFSFNWLKPAVLCLSAFLVVPGFLEDGTARADALEGRKVYEMHCIGCHGDKGDGKGVVADDFIVKPRNFILGMFKFSTTKRDALPTDEDLKKTISNGLPTTSMPNFRLLRDAEKDGVIDYIKTLSARWNKERAERIHPEVTAPDFVATAGSIGKGEKLFNSRCQMCHGTRQGQPDVIFFLKWKGAEACNDVIRPAVFSHGTIKRGPKVEDIHMSITAGVGGTPMLSWSDKLSEQNRWHLTSYILKDMDKVGGEK